jgi:hypothetical protein
VEAPIHGQSLCICGMKYLQHARLPAGHPPTDTVMPVPIPYRDTQANAMASQISNNHPYLNTSMATPWIAPQATQGTMEQQRRRSIQQHPAGVPASSVPSYYTTNPPASNIQRKQSPFPGGTRKMNRNEPVTSLFTCLIFPYPVSLAPFIAKT